VVEAKKELERSRANLERMQQAEIDVAESRQRVEAALEALDEARKKAYPPCAACKAKAQKQANDKAKVKDAKGDAEANRAENEAEAKETKVEVEAQKANDKAEARGAKSDVEAKADPKTKPAPSRSGGACGATWSMQGVVAMCLLGSAFVH